MSENVIADFVARFTHDASDSPEPARGRIVLSPKRLVLATSDGKTTVPLASIFDVNVGHVPQGMEAFFQDTVTIGFERDDERRVAVIESGTDEVAKFKTLLFKAQLNGVATTVKHPARVGGRVTDSRFRTGKLRIHPGKVEFYDLPDPFAVELANVTYFQKQDRTVNDGASTVVSIRHAHDGDTVTSEFAVPTERKLNLLGRYLRLEYTEIAEAAEEVDVSEEEMEALVAVYSGATSADLGGMLGSDAGSATMLLNGLREKGLVDEGTGGLSLTAQGQLLVSDRIEQVNT